MNPKVITLLETTKELPSLPIIYQEVSKAVDDLKSSPQSIGQIINKDQSLTSRLLRLANSAFYGFPRKVNTISDALQVIGLKELKDMVMSTAIIQCFKGIPEDLINIKAFWQHSIACGVGGSLLASQRHEPNVERFFIGGLLHDIGKLVLFIAKPAEMQQITARCAETKEFDYKVEQEILGFDHAEVGAGLIQKWGLPAMLADIVAFHHTPTLSQMAITEASIIHISDFLTNAMDLGNAGEFSIPILSKEAWERSHLDENCIDELMTQLDQQSEEMCAILVNE